MKKIMFNDKYGLTEAVLEGRKTQTRRIISTNLYNAVDWKAFEEGNHDCIIDPENPYNTDIRNYARYMIGEEVAIAQSYETLANIGGDILANMMFDETTFKPEYCGAGWRNKMFVKADLMPHRIKITNIRVEHLQDISDEDCLKEGIDERYITAGIVGYYLDRRLYGYPVFKTPREAFAYLIDKVGNKGDWDENPYVFVYEFELVR